MGIVAVLVKGSILDTNLIKWRIGPWFLGTDQQRFIMRMLFLQKNKTKQTAHKSVYHPHHLILPTVSLRSHQDITKHSCSGTKCEHAALAEVASFLQIDYKRKVYSFRCCAEPFYASSYSAHSVLTGCAFMS
ncbi:hypothetical protein KIL84_005313 [Mauremys mutica]|uniref:Uncharacterized protein n=1 Tax=Mauremys mutica TaxID=74926 RepID=A0A9D4AYT8_9SAUR|nr:hypothetical protein KIL84_005313 [Mauremys mutica]